METLYRFVGGIFFLCHGVLCLAIVISGRTLHSKAPGSRELGAPMPRWFGRPFAFVMGIVFIYVGVKVLSGEM